MSTWYKVTAFWGPRRSLLFLGPRPRPVLDDRDRDEREASPRHDRLRRRDESWSCRCSSVAPDLHEEPVRRLADRRSRRWPGLNPLLQNYWSGDPSAVALCRLRRGHDPVRVRHRALASGRLDDLWIGSVRVWMLICFGFLSLGLILGGRWATRARVGRLLGVGPGRERGMMPWFTATAFLHSAIIQEQRGMMKRWTSRSSA